MKHFNLKNFPSEFILGSQPIAKIDVQNLIDMRHLLQNREIQIIAKKMLTDQALEPEEVKLLGNELFQELKIQNLINHHFYDEHHVYSIEMDAIDNLSGDSVFSFINEIKARNRIVLFDGTGHGETAYKSSLIFQFAIHLLYEVGHTHPEDVYLERFTKKLIGIFGDGLGGAMFLDTHQKTGQVQLFGNLSAYHIKLVGRGKKAKVYPVLQQTSQSIGLMEQKYNAHEFKPSSSEIYVVFTDGFMSGGGKDKPRWMSDRILQSMIKKFLSGYYSNPSNWLKLGVIPAFKEFMQSVGVKPDDDTTVLTLRRR